jgi:signal transduction histidine kinase
MDSLSSEKEFLQASRLQAEHGLFLARFANWRVSMIGGIGLGLIVGGMYYYVTQAPALLWWMAANSGVFLTIAALCWHYERALPDPASATQRRWLRVWTVAGAVSGTVTGSLLWCLPPDRKDLVLSATVIISIAMIGYVASRGYRPILYATVIGQTLTVCTALVIQGHLALIVPLCVLFAAFVLIFGLALNRSMLNAIGQRLYAQHLAAELAEAHRRQLQVQQLESTLRERKRMMQDMHDGLGSALVSSLMMLESNKLSVAAAADVMRECVDDLRLIVDSQESAAQDVSTLVGMLRYRLQHRIQAAGLRLHWNMEELPERPWLNPSQSLDLLRILQEGIANALKHAQATEIEFGARCTDERIEFLIRDDGRGFDATAVFPEGRGLRGMRLRAERLGAAFTVFSEDAGGTTLTLSMPVPARSAARREVPLS